MSFALILISLLAGCGNMSAPGTDAEESRQAMDDALGPPPPPPPAAEEEAPAVAGAPQRAKARPMAGEGAYDLAPAEPEPAADDDGSADGGAEMRDWFPESFLWEPLVQTGDDGTATVDVRVPDTLTTWRVLALAHSRDGQQAGTVHTFDSRLPLYVDPVVPGWLYAGDRIELPVQVVNTTDEPVRATLEVSASGPLVGAGSVSLALPAQGSDVRWLSLDAEGAGEAVVRAAIGDEDAAERRVRVRPAGRPVPRTRGGTLGARRSFTLAGPDQADPSTQELSVLVFPGPLAVLQAEVERAASASGVAPWDAAYGWSLAEHLEALSARAGVEPDPDAARRLRLLAWQRMVPHTRAPDPGTAADLLAGLRDPAGMPLAEDLERRLVRVLVDGQRGDGSWARQRQAPLQQVIVQTALAAGVLPESERGARVRAEGALERFAAEIDDPYTAAVVLASGAIDGDLAVGLREQVVEAAEERSDGSYHLPVPEGVRSPWGWRPTRAEMAAWGALALADADVAWQGDLVSELMAGWDATWGFGAGPADVVALEAVAETLPGLDQRVEIALALGGTEVDRQALDPSQPKVPAVLRARPGGEDPAVELSVEPEVPGLVFVATLDSWVPWSGDEALAGVEVEVEAEGLQVGRDGTVLLTLAAPSGTALVVEQPLPAGAQVDEAALAAVDGLASHEMRTDRVRLVTEPFAAGGVREVPLVVRPAFAGSFATAPVSVQVRGRPGSEVLLPPVQWEVAPGGG